MFRVQQRISTLRALALPGAIAGIAGAVLIDIYLIVTLVLIAHVASVTSFYQFVASGALGPAAYANSSNVALGVGIHVLVSIGWGIGYAYVAATTPWVRDRPLLSGAVFGLVVMIAMQLVEVVGKIYVLPNSLAFFNGAIAHALFFGIPVAAIVKARLPAMPIPE